jgi:hypothetical protein
VLTHSIVVELPLEQAMRLFTPVGERLWGLPRIKDGEPDR